MTTTRHSTRAALALAALVLLGTLGLTASPSSLSSAPPEGAGQQAARPAAPQAPAQRAAQTPRATFRSGLDLVVVNVVVRDKDGKLVRGLKREDFVVTEDGKPQSISSFDFEEIENTSLPSM